MGLVRLQPGTIACFGQIPGTTPALPGMFPNMFPLATGQQFGALPVMPVQAMTQQVC
jgi:splicing factor U2AF subunit